MSAEAIKVAIPVCARCNNPPITSSVLGVGGRDKHRIECRPCGVVCLASSHELVLELWLEGNQAPAPDWGSAPCSTCGHILNQHSPETDGCWLCSCTAFETQEASP